MEEQALPTPAPPLAISLFRAKLATAIFSSSADLFFFLFLSSSLPSDPSPLSGIRCIVTLECTEARAEGGTPSRYTTQKVG